MSYPSSIPAYNGFTPTHSLSQDQHGEQHNSEQADIIALATKVGTGASTPTQNTVLRGNGTGTSTFDQLHLATDVSGVLSTSNGGSGTNTVTGSGNLVLATAPTTTNETLNTPTIVNPNTTYLSNSIPAGVLEPGAVSFTNLLSTIFSGQIQTQANSGSAGGTFSYINLGGIKLLWGTTGGIATGNTGTVTFPAFFTTVTSAVATMNNASGTDQVVAAWSGIAITGGTIKLTAVAGSGTMSVGFLVIGT